MDNRTDNKWESGIWGVVVGDALGEPVQFISRAELAEQEPVRGMESGRLYANIPAGTWTDDSSLTLALLDSIREKKTIDLTDIMERFRGWLNNGEYTPFGEAFDIGRTTILSIRRYEEIGDPHRCGGDSERSNGNGSLMRIMPACLYAYEKQLDEGMTDADAVGIIHEVSALTHAHLRSKIACGLYYFCVKAILDSDPSAQTDGLISVLQRGLDNGFAFYEQDITNLTELAYFGRIRDLSSFADTPADAISSSGYVVHSLEAAIWSLINTESYAECELKAVNLADDSDSVAAIAGGLAGLYYGYERIPSDWLDAIQRSDLIRGILSPGGDC